MIKARMALGLVMALGALLVSAAPALAEFESLNTAGQGKGNVVEVKLTGGGGTVECTNTEEATGRIGWTVKSEGKEAKKGSALQVKVEGLSSCLAKSETIKEAPATLGQCEMETKQPKSETETLDTFIKECVVKVKVLEVTCEIKITTANKELSKVNLYDSGKENEELIVGPDVKGITDEVNKACETAGVKGGGGNVMQAYASLGGVRSTARGEMVIGASPRLFGTINTPATVTVINTGSTQKPSVWLRNISPPGSFTQNRTQEENCEFKLVYTMNEACNFGVEYKGVGGHLDGWEIYGVAGADHVESVVMLW